MYAATSPAYSMKNTGRRISPPRAGTNQEVPGPLATSAPEAAVADLEQVNARKDNHQHLLYREVRGLDLLQLVTQLCQHHRNGRYLRGQTRLTTSSAIFVCA